MPTVHLRNTVRDFDEWKAVFSKFDRFRADHGVRSHRISRSLDDPQKVVVDVDFETETQARAFLEALVLVRATPQSHQQLVASEPPEIYAVVDAQEVATLH